MKDRKSLSKKILSDGFSSLSESEKIDYLLLCSKVKNSESIGEQIRKMYGEFRMLSDADPCLLMKSAEVTDSFATLLRLIPVISKECMLCRKNITNLSDTETAKKYYSDFFIGSTEEKFVVTAVDSNFDIKETKIISSGNGFAVDVNKRSIIDFAVRNGSDMIFISHNHPTGRCKASNDDINTTSFFLSTLKKLNIGIVDHIIVGNNGECSMREEKIHGLDGLFYECEYRIN